MKNTPIPGFLIYAFQKIRDVKLIELRNGFNKNFDKSVLFFVEQMGKSIYTNDIDLIKWEEIKYLSLQYAVYTIHYSTEPLSKVHDSLGEEYNYVLISSSEDIVKDYYLARKEFLQKTNLEYFCEIQDIFDLIQIPREHFLVEEFGEILAV